MEVGNCRLILNKGGSDVPLFNVTPGEVKVLRAAYTNLVGREPVTDLVSVGTKTITDAAEKARLHSKYPNLKLRLDGKDINAVSAMLPEGSTLPKAFKDVGVEAPRGKQSGPKTYNPEPAGSPILADGSAVGEDGGITPHKEEPVKPPTPPTPPEPPKVPFSKK